RLGAATRYLNGGPARWAHRRSRREVGQDRGREVERILVGSTVAERRDGVVAEAGVEHEVVGARAAHHDVIAETADNDVVASAAVERVVAGAAVEHVGRIAAGDRVVPGTAGGVLDLGERVLDRRSRRATPRRSGA